MELISVDRFKDCGYPTNHKYDDIKIGPKYGWSYLLDGILIRSFEPSWSPLPSKIYMAFLK